MKNLVNIQPNPQQHPQMLNGDNMFANKDIIYG